MTAKNFAVIFLETPHNRYSLAVLTGVLEVDERLHDVDLHFVTLEPQRRPGIVNIPACIDQLETLIQRYKKAVIALSFPTASVVTIADLLRDLHQGMTIGPDDAVLLVAGGPHPSGDPAGTLQLGADVVVIGEGEVTFPTLLDNFFRNQSYEQVQGIWYVDTAGQTRSTGRPAAVDISNFPPFAAWHKRFCPMEISRGCPYGCQFCQTTFFMGGRMRHRSLESILHYAELPRRIGMKVLRFITPSAFAYGSPDGRSVNLEALEQMLRVASEMYGKDDVYLGSFPSEVRPEHVSSDTLELVTRYCSNTNLQIGAQSGSDRMLHILRRGHCVDDVVRAVELSLNAGLSPNVDFIFGLPGETAQDRQDTLALIHRLTGMGGRVHSHAFMPLVGTPLAHCPPGVLDDELRKLMINLRGKNLEHGRWQQHEKFAQKTAAFLRNQHLTK